MDKNSVLALALALTLILSLAALTISAVGRPDPPAESCGEATGDPAAAEQAAVALAIRDGDFAALDRLCREQGVAEACAYLDKVSGGWYRSAPTRVAASSAR